MTFPLSARRCSLPTLTNEIKVEQSSTFFPVFGIASQFLSQLPRSGLESKLSDPPLVVVELGG